MNESDADSDLPEFTTAPPPPSAAETVAEMCRRSGRSATPIRSSFVQQPPGSQDRPSVLADFVTRGDRRGLEALLLVLTVASSEPYDVRFESRVWARALEIRAVDHATAVSKVWSRLADRNLITRERVRRRARITPLREDGSGQPYARPVGADGDTYFNLDHAYWTQWRDHLSLSGLAMLLVSLHAKPGFELPFERVPEWYGFSADTAQTGMSELRRHGLVSVTKTYRVAPLSPTGSVEVRRYQVQPPFRAGDA